MALVSVNIQIEWQKCLKDSIAGNLEYAECRWNFDKQIVPAVGYVSGQRKSD